ncbi:MAG: hypothetical protein R6X15_01285 [Pseudomonadota bacterium]
MKRNIFSEGLSAIIDDGRLVLCGDLTQHNSCALLEWLQKLSPINRVDLAELDIEDGVAATRAVDAVRLLSARVSVLCLNGVPQVLAHNLYRIGLLGAGNIELVDMRQDEPYG